MIKSNDFQEALKFAQKYFNVEDIPEEDLPKKWDWRDVNGFDFSGEVRD